jgi:hypothetical protein
VDAFNALNHVNATNFVGVLSSPLFGRANSALPDRQIQLSMKASLCMEFIHYHLIVREQIAEITPFEGEVVSLWRLLPRWQSAADFKSPLSIFKIPRKPRE